MWLREETERTDSEGLCCAHPWICCRCWPRRRRSSADTLSRSDSGRADSWDLRAASPVYTPPDYTAALWEHRHISGDPAEPHCCSVCVSYLEPRPPSSRSGCSLSLKAWLGPPWRLPSDPEPRVCLQQRPDAAESNTSLCRGPASRRRRAAADTAAEHSWGTWRDAWGARSWRDRPAHSKPVHSQTPEILLSVQACLKSKELDAVIRSCEISSY